MTRKSMMGLVRKERAKFRGPSFLITWDVDSSDRGAVNRLQYFLFGRESAANGGDGLRHGFVWKEGVRYIAQSALYVVPERLEEVARFLKGHGIDHEFEAVVLP